MFNIEKAQQCHIQWLNPSFWFNFEYDSQHFESIEFMLKVWLNFYLLLKKILESYNKFAWISISFKINGHVTTSCLDLRFKYAFLLDFFFLITHWWTFWKKLRFNIWVCCFIIQHFLQYEYYWEINLKLYSMHA